MSHPSTAELLAQRLGEIAEVHSDQHNLAAECTRAAGMLRQLDSDLAVLHRALNVRMELSPDESSDGDFLLRTTLREQEKELVLFKEAHKRMVHINMRHKEDCERNERNLAASLKDLYVSKNKD